MSTPTNSKDKGAEEKRAIAACELAKEFIPAAILAQGPLSPASLPADVAAYYERACNMAFSLAGMYRRKCIEVINSAKVMDEKSQSNAT